jgi:hypothetical protein
MKKYHSIINKNNNLYNKIYIFFKNIYYYFLFFNNLRIKQKQKIYFTSKIKYIYLRYNSYFNSKNFKIIITPIEFENGYICLLINKKKNEKDKYFRKINLESDNEIYKLISSRTIIIPKNYYLNNYFRNENNHRLYAKINIYDINDIFIYGIIEYDSYNKFLAYLLVILYILFFLITITYVYIYKFFK